MTGEQASDTIYARATGAGAAPIAIIRISGHSAHKCVAQLLPGVPPPPRRLALRRLVDPASGEMLDEAMVVLFEPPSTATGEPMAELHVHGGRAVVSAVTDALARLGARPATAGEFSRRALVNGRADLTRLEAVAALIDAETAAQRRAALRNLSGALSDRIEAWRSEILVLQTDVNAALDFSDQDVPDVEIDALAGRMRALALDLRTCAAAAKRMESLVSGVEVALVGAPNAGKSSLLNRLVGRDMALTSAIPGTTRDVIEGRCVVGDHVVTFLDTAGLRESVDETERVGVAWGARRAAAAAMVIGVCAPDAPLCPTSVDLMVWNKTDLAEPPVGFSGVATSALTGLGLDDLLDAVRVRLGSDDGEVAEAINERQARGLLSAAQLLEDAVDVDLDLAAEHLRDATQAIESVIGRVDVEDVLDRIFAGFCIGK